MWRNPQKTSDLVKFSEEILNGKLHFLCSDGSGNLKLNLKNQMDSHKIKDWNISLALSIRDKTVNMKSCSFSKLTMNFYFCYDDVVIAV